MLVETMDQALGRVSRELDSATFDSDHQAIRRLEAERAALLRLQRSGDTWTVSF